MDHTVLPANYTMLAFTPQPQNITALWLVLISPLLLYIGCRGVTVIYGHDTISVFYGMMSYCKVK